MKNCKILFWLIILSLPLAAQNPKSATKPQPPTAKSNKLRGIITVRVLSDDGQPLDEADVSLSPAFAAPTPNAYFSPEKPTRQKDGSFRFENVSVGLYHVSASAPGYVKITNEPAEVPPTVYRVGETAHITLTRGGVITGTVTDTDGMPLVEARVRAIRVRNQFNERISQISPDTDLTRFSSELWTDDRGVYRIFGLPPGAYLVVAGSRQGSYFSWQIDPTSGAPTYYPSDPIETATEVAVTYGQEVGGIDVRYRNEAGQTISGVISGAVKTNSRYGDSVNVSLVRRGSSLPEATADVREENGRFAFKMEQIPSGEYQLQAVQSGDRGREVSSKPIAIKITDKDVGELELRLQPLTTVTGKMIFTADATLKNKPECQSKRIFAPEETELRLRPDAAQTETAKLPETDSLSFANIGRAPDENGDFAFRGLEAGKYRLTWELPNDNLFARSLKSFDGKINFGKDGLSLNAGGLTNLILAVSDGAATLRGNIESPAAGKENSENAPDAGFLVELIPAEKEAADDFVRYAETITTAGGNFEFKNLAPGAYFLVAKAFVKDKEKIVDFRRPLFWSAVKRAELLQVAIRNKNNRIELAPCQNRAAPPIVIEMGK